MPNNVPGMLTVREYAEKEGVTLQTAYRRIWQGQIIAKQFLGRWLIAEPEALQKGEAATDPTLGSSPDTSDGTSKRNARHHADGRGSHHAQSYHLSGIAQELRRIEPTGSEADISLTGIGCENNQEPGGGQRGLKANGVPTGCSQVGRTATSG